MPCHHRTPSLNELWYVEIRCSARLMLNKNKRWCFHYTTLKSIIVSFFSFSSPLFTSPPEKGVVVVIDMSVTSNSCPVKAEHQTKTNVQEILLATVKREFIICICFNLKWFLGDFLHMVVAGGGDCIKSTTYHHFEYLSSCLLAAGWRV